MRKVLKYRRWRNTAGNFPGSRMGLYGNRFLKSVMFVVTVLLSVSCEEQTEWPLQEEPQQRIVVDGMITSQYGTQEIRLHYSVTGLNEVPVPVNGAEVIVSDADSVFLFEESAEPGIYFSRRKFAGRVGNTYSLQVSDSAEVYVAKDKMGTAYGYNMAEYAFDGGRELYYISRVTNAYLPDKPAIYEILLDWHGLPGYLDKDSADCTASLRYYSLPSLDVSQVLSPGAETVYFPAGTRITEKRYSVSDAYASFLRALLAETTWQGGLFNSAAANVPTNVSNGALGFFAACPVVVKTAVVK